MAKKSVELRQKKRAIYDQAHKLIKREESGGSKLLPEERAKADQMFADMDDLDSQIKTAESYEARSAEFANNAYDQGGADPKSDKQEQRSYDDRFIGVLRSGFRPSEVRSLAAEYRLGIGHKVEQRAATDPQSVAVSAEGGLLVPTSWAQSIEKEMQAYGEVLSAVNAFSTTGGGVINFPYQDDFSKGRIIGENATAAIKNMEWKNKAIGSFKYTSDQIPVPYELLQDAAYNVAGEVAMKCGERIGRILAEHITTGDGSGKPEGILTGAAASGKVTAGATLTADLITQLEHSVNRAHRNKANAKFMMHDSTVAALKLLSIGSGDDRPLWRMSMRDGEPDTINGYNYITNDEMPELTGATGSKVIAFGDFSKYRLRQVGGYRLLRLTELGALQDQTIFIAYARYDGKLIISNAIKTLAVGA